MALPSPSIGAPGTPNLVNQQPGTPGTPGQPQFQTLPPQFPTQTSGAVNPGTPGTPSFPAASMVSPNKEVNTASLCHIGQETVQDIVQKTAEMCQQLKATQVPNTQVNSAQMYADRKAKTEEILRTINVTFKKLRLIYTKINENCAVFEQRDLESLVPFKNGNQIARPEPNALFYSVTEEKREVSEQLHAKNCQLKEVIDQLRTVVWEINTMMAMRKT